ncbi:MAG: hypothetical protein HC852_19270 [Acaryochloridaceae cyanobacterium RU_4_10]|nr:hypothetical protein [Acaryochloridaceae cyanobacterium RU_4_10]
MPESSLTRSTKNPPALETMRSFLEQSFQKGSQWLTQWFQVSEVEVQQLLEQVRQTLPTTEVILIGKAQTGKSSIIRALTGATPEIIGQGFKPHTAHTQRYVYPTDDLPLLTFIDTVGLGEGLKDPQNVAREFQDLLRCPSSNESQPAARILVTTVKGTDFATDSLHRLLKDIRQDYPQIPCLLVITCLHELYPASLTDHPVYPPTDESVRRACRAIQDQFQDICDRTALIDFTLEEDGFTPVFYGLEPFVEDLAALLPHAEAQVIHQLLEQAGVGDQIGNMYRQAGRRYILPFSVMAATLAAVPLPLATMPVLTSLQVTMVTLLGRLYGQSLSTSQAGGVVSAIAGGFAAQLIGRELVKFIPGLGSVIAASWAGAYTWALGESACVYFGDLMGGQKPDPQKIQQAMKDSFKSAQERFKASVIERR